MTDFGDVRMYFGSANGSAHKALRIMEEPHILLSATTKMNQPWNGIGELFVDSGGYSLMKSAGEHWPIEQYLDSVEDMGADYFSVQDYPCEPEIMDEYGRSVQQHQEMTTENTVEALSHIEDRGINAEPVTVVQGWGIEDYPDHVDQLRERGCLTDRVAIGSVCRRGESDRIREIIRRTYEALPAGTEIHAFGVKSNILTDRETQDRLYSVDTCAWYQYSHQGKIPDEPTFQTFCSHYIDYWRSLHEKSEIVEKANSAADW